MDVILKTKKAHMRDKDELHTEQVIYIRIRGLLVFLLYIDCTSFGIRHTARLCTKTEPYQHQGALHQLIAGSKPIHFYLRHVVQEDVQFVYGPDAHNARLRRRRV